MVNVLRKFITMLIEQKVYKDFVLQSIDKSEIPLDQAMSLFKKDIDRGVLIESSTACVIIKVKPCMNKVFNRIGDASAHVHRHYHGSIWFTYLKSNGLLV